MATAPLDLASYLSAIDLSTLPAPEMIEQLSYDTVFSTLLTDFVRRRPDYSILLESDPVIKILEVEGYREQLLRQSFNDRAQQLLLAFAARTNLDHLAARLGVVRAVVQAADNSVFPAKPLIMESDTSLRRRAQLAPEAFSSAGPPGAYLYHTFSASPGVFDAAVYNNASGLVQPGTVLVVVMIADTFVADDVMALVRTRLFRDDIKPVTDDVQLRVAAAQLYAISATIHTKGGPSPTLAGQAAFNRLKAYLASRNRIGALIADSGIYAALHGPYVEKVELSSPATDFDPGLTGFAQASAVSLRIVPNA